MTATRLKRKDRKNLARAGNKTRVIKQMLARPVIKQVNMEELQAKYGTATSAAAKPAKKEAPQVAAAAPVAAAPVATEE